MGRQVALVRLPGASRPGLRCGLRVGAGLAAAASALAALALAGCSSASTDPVGVWGDPDAQGAPSIEFAAPEHGESGEYWGSDGCNRIGGTYTRSGDRIDLGAMRSTRMLCEGVDTWLSNAQAARFAGDELVFSDASGTDLSSLARHAAS